MIAWPQKKRKWAHNDAMSCILKHENIKCYSEIYIHLYGENTRLSLSLSFSLWSGWHFCLDDFNKLLHTKLNKVRVRCCWGNFANYNYSIPGPKGKFALHSKRDSGNGTGFISGSNSGYGLVSGRIKRFTSFRPRRKVRSKEAGKMAAPVKQRERERRGR